MKESRLQLSIILYYNKTDSQYISKFSSNYRMRSLTVVG